MIINSSLQKVDVFISQKEINFEYCQTMDEISIDTSQFNYALYTILICVINVEISHIISGILLLELYNIWCTFVTITYQRVAI